MKSCLSVVEEEKSRAVSAHKSEGPIYFGNGWRAYSLHLKETEKRETT